MARLTRWLGNRPGEVLAVAVICCAVPLMWYGQLELWPVGAAICALALARLC